MGDVFPAYIEHSYSESFDLKTLTKPIEGKKMILNLLVIWGISKLQSWS